MAPAQAADLPSRAQAEGSALSGEGVIDLDAILKDATAFAPTADGGLSENNDMDLTLLSGLDLPLGDGINLPLLNNVLQVGALGQYAKVEKGGQSVAAAGAVTGEGLLAVNGADATQSTSVKLSPILKALGLDSLISELKVDVKAIASRATANPGEVAKGEYAVAGVNLDLDAKAVAALTQTLKTTVKGVDDTLGAAIGENGAVNSALDVVNKGLVPLVNVVLALLTAKADTEGTEITVKTDLAAALDPILSETLSDPDEVVSLRLSDGRVTVDLAKIMNQVRSELPQPDDRTVCTDESTKPGGLNCLPAKTEVLQSAVINAIVERLTDLVSGVTDKLNKVIKTALDTTAVKVGLNLDVKSRWGAGPSIGKIGVSIDTTLGQLLGWDDTKPEVHVTTKIAGIDLSALTDAIVGGILKELVPTLGGAVKPVVDTALSGTLVPAVTTLVTGVVKALDPLLETVQELVSVKVNVQEEPGNFIDSRGNDADSFTERALSLGLIPSLKGGEGLLVVNLGTSTVIGEPKAITTALEVTPNPALPGNTVDVKGSGFEPGEKVTVTFPDGSTKDVDAGDQGGFSTPWTIPSTQPAGTLEFKATGETSQKEATDSIEVKDWVAPTYELKPGHGPVGASVEVVGEGFEPGSTVTITIGGVVAGTVTADADGKVSGQHVDVPSGTDAAGGSTANDGVNPEAKADFEVTVPTLEVSPSSGEKGSTFAVTLTGYPAGADVKVTFDGQDLGTHKADADGKLTLNDVKVPADQADGTYDVVGTVVGRDAITAKDTFEVTSTPVPADPQLVVAPESGKPGDDVTVTLTGYPANTEVVVTLDGKEIGRTTTDADGAGTVTGKVPADATVGSTTVVGTGGDKSAQDDFEVLPAGGAEAEKDLNANASASAGASAQADSAKNAAAVAAAVAAAMADATSQASAAADASAEKAAAAAATADASKDASASSKADATSAATAAAQAAALADASSQAAAEKSAAADANAGAAASAAANADASKDASADAAGDADGTVSNEPKSTVAFKTIVRGTGVEQVVTGTDFQPGETVNATVHSKPIKLKAAKADAKGKVTFRFAVGATFELGDHSVDLVGAKSGEVADKNDTTQFKVLDGIDVGQERPVSSDANSTSTANADGSSNGSGSANGSGAANGSGNGSGLVDTGASSGLLWLAGLALLLVVAGGVTLAIRQRRKA